MQAELALAVQELSFAVALLNTVLHEKQMQTMRRVLCFWVLDNCVLVYWVLSVELTSILSV